MCRQAGSIEPATPGNKDDLEASKIENNSRSLSPRGIIPGDIHRSRCYSDPAGKRQTTINNQEVCRVTAMRDLAKYLAAKK